MLLEWKRITQRHLDPVYLIIGTEDYIINETKRLLVSHVLEEEDLIYNYANFDLEETSIETVIEEAETFPFFGDKRLIVASNPIFLTSEKSKSKIEHQVSRLETYLKEPAPYSLLCFIARFKKLDERKKLTKQLKKVATIIEAKSPNEKEFVTWIQRTLEKEGYKASIASIRKLQELTAGNLSRAMSELKKLMLYIFPQKEITEQHVEDLVVRSLEEDIFLLLDKLIDMDIGGSLRIYYDLLKQKEEPLRIIALISGQFRLMKQIKILEKSGYNPPQMASKLRVHPFRIKLTSRQAQKFTDQELDLALLKLAKIDLELKTSYVNRNQQLEWFLFQLQDERRKRNL